MDKIETPEEFDVHAFDARVWAKAFCDRFPGHDEGLMLGWFANAIMAGYDHAGFDSTAIRADERQKAVEWISVKERLPEENHAVLIYYDKHITEAMFFDGDWGLPNGDWIMGHTVSFWMPLPFPPAIMAKPEEATKC